MASGGRISASIAIDGQDLEGDIAHLRWFIVDDTLRGTGIGKRLLDAAIAFCDAQGFSETHLWMFQGLDTSRALYERVGFRLAEEKNGQQWGADVLDAEVIRQKRPLLSKQVWAIRARLQLANNLRDLALFNVAIDSKLRGCDLVRLSVVDLVKEDCVRERVSVIQSKTRRPVQFELTENIRDPVLAWVKSPEMLACLFMFPNRFHDCPHISTRQYGRLVHDWVSAIGLEPSGYGTHSLRRTKAAEIYRKTGNLRAVQLLLGHTKVDSTVRYLGVELEDALSIAENIDL
ncbi:GNAT family N-acetyltransferase [uncultured Roseobacter sp.]|uniref:GNAT family N-acetyltransferase n=1 Tax=uncultured Roseobacter sp. TaxID=114847 RepID=UPI00262279E8|nr:GNAT family N-acetyltransferase [uncultured Roseobacter sp.]